MRTNRVNRFLAFCFALLMLAGMAKTVVMEASAVALPASNWDGGVIQVTLNSGEEEGDKVSVTAYKLVSVNAELLPGTDPAAYQPQEPEYTWEAGIAGWVRTNYPAYIGEGSDNSVQEAFSTENTAIDAAEFYAKVEAAIIKQEITGLSSASRTGAGDITGLTMGVYLITATGGTSVYCPHVASITPAADENGSWTITSPAEVTLKSSPVSLDKTITSEKKTVGVGDTVSYQLEVDVPTYPSQAVSRTFVITDTLPEGLTLQKDTVIVEDETFTTSLSDRISVTGQVLTINLTPDDGKANKDPIAGKTTLTITYDAVLNENAQLGSTGNVNTAALTYSNDPYITGSSKTVEDEEIVYTFGIEVTKVQKGQEQTALPGAEFELKDANNNVIKFKGENGVYVKALDQTDTSATSVLVTGNDGKLTIKGLAPGTYKLKETKAPAGYVLSANTIEVEIKDDDQNGILDSKEAEDTKPKEDNGLREITVENTKGFTLPQTGGFGTVLFSMIGIVLMGGGVLLVAVFLRKFFAKTK